MKKDTKLEQKITQSIEIKLIESTVEKRTEIIARAKERAKRIIQAAEHECKLIRSQFKDNISNKIAIEIQTLKDKMIREVEEEGKNIVMRAREEVILMAFKKVEERLQEIVERKDALFNFDEIFFKLIIEAILAIGGKNFIIFTNNREINYLKQNQNKIVDQIQHIMRRKVNVQVSDKPITTIGGVIVQNMDGTKIYYNTFEGRLKTVRDKSEVVVAKILEIL